MQITSLNYYSYYEIWIICNIFFVFTHLFFTWPVHVSDITLGITKGKTKTEFPAVCPKTASKNRLICHVFTQRL